MPRPRIVGVVLALVVGSALLILAVRFLPVADWVGGFADWVSGQGARGVVIFSAGYVLATLLLVPGSLLAIAAGVVFGMPWGVLIAVASATVAAILAFLASRYLARGAVSAWIRKHRMFGALDAAIGARQGRIILLMRLSPIVPASLSNYFFGVTRARLWKYVLATPAGIAPGIFLEVYLGHMGMATLRPGEAPLSGAQIAMLGAGLAVTAVLTWYLARVAKRELHKHQPKK
jgi:uncharacterized membrane protein YdjX (TVP38/TMEM64 family)